MFTSARLKLTAWYLLISMLISVLFSIAIFYILSLQLDTEYLRLYHRYEIRRELLPDQGRSPLIDLQSLDASKDNILTSLVYINLFILVISASAGYFLAGRTLRPIKEMLDEQKRFISDASHELRTPLTALRTTLEVNLRDKNLNLKQAKSVFKDNLEEVEGLQALCDSLLVIAKAQNKGNLRFQNVSLKAVVDEAVGKLSVLAKQKDIEINQDIENVSFQADTEKMIRLVIILLDNAVKYSSLSTKVHITGKQLDHKIQIKVKDQGLGILEKDLPFIFNRFYRVDKSRSRIEGYGLGLSIAQKIVQLHQGSIEVSSKPGKGTIFTILLPVSKPRRIF